MGLPLRLRISMIPAGVHGASAGAGEQAARVHGMEAVDVFRRIDGVKKRFRIDLRGERQLDEDAVNVVARVEAGDE